MWKNCELRGRGRIGSVQADDVEILILDPDAAQEAALAGLLLGGDIENDAAHVAQKFAVNVFEVVVRAVEVVAVGEDHPGEADGLVLELEQLAEAAQQARSACPSVSVFQIVLAVDGIAQVQAAEEIVVLAGRGAQLRIGVRFCR